MKERGSISFINFYYSIKSAPIKQVDHPDLLWMIVYTDQSRFLTVLTNVTIFFDNFHNESLTLYALVIWLPTNTRGIHTYKHYTKIGVKLMKFYRGTYIMIIMMLFT